MFFVSRSTLGFLAATTSTAMLASAGCSMTPGQGPKTSIRLAPQTTVPNLMETAFSTLATPTQLSDLNCFAVNAVGPGISTHLDCSRTVQVGVIDGFRQGIDSTFSLTVPISDSLTLEAYAEAGVCTSIDAHTPNGGTNSATYRLGKVTVASEAFGKDILIPVAFDPTAKFSCSSTPPYVVFSDDFSYSGSLPANGPGWTSAATPNDFSTGGTTAGMSINAQSNFAPAVVATKPYYAIQVNVALSSCVTAGSYKFAVGLAGSNADTTTDTVGCVVDYTAVTCPTTFNPSDLKVGTSAASGVVGIVDAAPVPASPVGAFTLTCEIGITSTTTADIKATITDSQGTVTTRSVTGASLGACANGACLLPYLAEYSTGITTLSGSFDDYKVLVADTPQ